MIRACRTVYAAAQKRKTTPSAAAGVGADPSAPHLDTNRRGFAVDLRVDVQDALRDELDIVVKDFGDHVDITARLGIGASKLVAQFFADQSHFLPQFAEQPPELRILHDTDPTSAVKSLHRE